MVSFSRFSMLLLLPSTWLVSADIKEVGGSECDLLRSFIVFTGATLEVDFLRFTNVCFSDKVLPLEGGGVSSPFINNSEVFSFATSVVLLSICGNDSGDNSSCVGVSGIAEFMINGRC